MTVIRFPDLGSNRRIDYATELAVYPTSVEGIRIAAVAIASTRDSAPHSVAIAIAGQEAGDYDDLTIVALTGAPDADAAIIEREKAEAARVAASFRPA